MKTDRKEMWTPSVSFKLAEGDKAPEEIQVIRTGEYSHPLYGNFTIDEGFLGQMIVNFNEKVRGVDLAVDYAHESWQKAAGWFTELFTKEGGTELWAKIKWTPAGQKGIEDKEWRYFSADFDENYVDNETKEEFGPTLYGAALTNRPFVKHMAPAVKLSDQQGDKDMKTVKELEAENKKLSETIEDLQTKVAKFEDGKDKKALEDKIASLEEQLNEYKEQLTAMEKEKKTSEKEAQFAKMLADKKAVPAQKEAFMEGDMVKFAELSEAVNEKPSGTEEDADDVDSGDPQDKILELADEMIKKDSSLTKDRAISKVLSENPELKAKAYGA